MKNNSCVHDNRVEELYNFFHFPSKKFIVCNAPQGKCINKSHLCKECNFSLKVEKYSISERQQFSLIKIFLSTLVWRELAELPFKKSYEEGLAELILKNWDRLHEDAQKKIKDCLLG